MDGIPVTLNILDKEYRIACPPGEQEALLASANLLNNRIQELKRSGKAIGGDRLAIMVALNLAHDYIVQSDEKSVITKTVNTRIKSLQERIDNALKGIQQLEL